LEVQFDLLGQPFPFMPDNFFHSHLINPPYTDERGNSRKFGFINSPTVQDSISMMTRIGVSAFKKSLLELPIGTEVEIDGVDGHNHLPDDVQIQFVWIADAIGIAPFMSIVREIKAKNLQNKVTLDLHYEKSGRSSFYSRTYRIRKREFIVQIYSHNFRSECVQS
jgi:ferredoxin-NADP reductase